MERHCSMIFCDINVGVYKCEMIHISNSSVGYKGTKVVLNLKENSPTMQI